MTAQFGQEAAPECLTEEHAPRMAELLRSSLDPDYQQEAAEVLGVWERMPGFCSLLLVRDRDRWFSTTRLLCSSLAGRARYLLGCRQGPVRE